MENAAVRDMVADAFPLQGRSEMAFRVLVRTEESWVLGWLDNLLLAKITRQLVHVILGLEYSKMLFLDTALDHGAR
jgi:hypothetical protein